MKIKTSELTGTALNWAVDFALNGECVGYAEHEYSYYWEYGGPIIEREGISLDQYHDFPNWAASCPPESGFNWFGPTPLIAAMRCYVASRLGDEVEIPDELI